MVRAESLSAAPALDAIGTRDMQGSQELVRTAEIGPFGRRVDFRNFRRFRPSEPMWVRLQGCAPTAQYGELAQAERQACAWVTDVAF